MKTNSNPNTINLSLTHSIRGVAAIYVVVYHAKFVLWSGGREFINQFPRSTWDIADYLNFGITLLFNSGHQMVMIFFVLSGYFIAMSLDKSNGPFSKRLKLFYIVRSIRIYAPYLASIAVAVATLYFISFLTPDLLTLDSAREFNNRLIVAYGNISITNFLKSLIFLKHEEYIGFNFVYWSLLYEFIFYLMVPFVQRIKKLYLVISGILFLAGVFLKGTDLITYPIFKYLFEYNFYFAMGQALYFYRIEIAGFLRVKNYKMSMLLLCGFLFIIFDFLALVHYILWANFIAAITGGLLLIYFLNYQIKIIFFMRVIKYLGEISYSLYIIHLPVLLISYSVLYRVTGQTVFYGFEYIPGIAFAVMGGTLLHYLIEKPSLAFIRKVKKMIQSSNKNLIPEPSIALGSSKENNQHK